MFCVPVGANALTCSQGTLVVVEVGQQDNFVLPVEPVYPDNNLVTFVATAWGIPLRWLDETSVNTVMAHTFFWEQQEICEAELEVRARSEGDMSYNDRFNLEFRDEWLEAGGEVWRWTLPFPTLTNTAWDYGDAATIVLNLGDLPVDLYGRTSVLPYMLDGDLDVVIDDDTNVDYMVLRLCVMCAVPVRETTWGQIKTLYAD
jgi:hypothetical protein